MSEHNPAPLGATNHTQRTCSRLFGHDPDGSELLCGATATQHIIYWWRQEAPGENPDDCWDHGYACAPHWEEFQQRWSCAASHELKSACGMPGSLFHPEENRCRFNDLPVAEPVRAMKARTG